MSEPGPPPADREALRRAVRPLRLAAAAFSAPFAKAEAQLSSVEMLLTALAPELELVTFSPLAQLADLAAFDDGTQALPAARRSRRPPTPRSSSSSPGRRAPVAGSSPAAAPAAPRGSTLAGSAHAAPAAGESVSRDAAAPPGRAGTPTAAAAPGATAPAPPPERIQLASGPAPASGTRAPQPLELLESLVREAEESLRSPSGPAAPPFRSSPAPTSPNAPAASVPPADPNRPADSGVQPLDAIPPSSRVPETAARQQFDPGRAGAPVAGTELPPPAPPLEQLRRALLSTPLITGAPHAPTATPGGSVAPAAPAASARPADAARAPAADPAGTTLEPADLAWLVNEALIEQARRHGVDLT